MSVSPRDIRSVLPEGGRLPRVGKLRLGIRKESSKNGSLVSFPSAVDYFVVNEDASTSRQAAEAFHEVYGPEPRELRVTLPAAALGDILEGAWRSYGSGGLLKRRCSGPGGECVTRGPDGIWLPSPCKCQAEGLDPEDKKRHCQERFTLTVMLMDVRGVGVWQVDTGSRMAAEGLASVLRMIESFRGHLQGAAATLRVVPRQVSPKGVAKTVYILELGAGDITPAQALELGGGPSVPQRVELPPSTLDDGPDDLLDVEAAEVVAPWQAPGPRPDDQKHPEQVKHETAMEARAGLTDGLYPEGRVAPVSPAPDTQATEAAPIVGQIKAMTKMHQAEFYRVAGISKGTPGSQVTTMVKRTWERTGMSPDVPVDVPTLLQVLLDIERQKAKTPVSQEAFEHEIKTGEAINEGDQTKIGEA